MSIEILTRKKGGSIGSHEPYTGTMGASGIDSA